MSINEFFFFLSFSYKAILGLIAFLTPARRRYALLTAADTRPSYDSVDFFPIGVPQPIGAGQGIL